ncbi:MAG: hypothetical protein JWO38_1312, partial [Gemmataceae bacterium]|nr:hypothetical protein [Gemmataceae bacterium]
KPPAGVALTSNGPPAAAPVPGTVAAGGPEMLIPLGPVPVSPPGVASVGGPAPVNPAAGTPLTGRQYLDQAMVEYRKGDFELARRLALQAHNLGAQDEARGLLNSIDAEAFGAKQRVAARSLEAAAEAVRNNEHERALRVIVLIDPKLLAPEMRARKDELVAACRAELDKTGGPKSDAGLVAAGGMQPPMTGGDLQPFPGSPPAGTNPPGTARVGTGPPTDPKPAGPDGLTNQADAMRKVTFQKLRGDGLKVQADAQATFGRGETDIAIQMLVEYSNRVRAANLDPASVALLLKPVDSRIEMFQVMKGNTDAVARLNREKKDAKDQLTNRGAADEQRKAEVQKLAHQYHALVRESKFAEAERVALQAKQLEPDDPGIAAMAYMATINRRVRDAEKLKKDKADFFLTGLNKAEEQGPFVDTQDPVAVQVERMRMARRRGRGDDAYLKSHTPKEFEIESKLDMPISVEFNQTPLSEVIENLRTLTGLPFSYDTAALEAEAVSTAKPISEKLPGVSARNALHLILDKVGLSFVIEYDSVRITTLKKAKGRLVTKVFSVADLVTPIPNFALPEYANFDRMLLRDARSSPNAIIKGLNDNPSPYVPRGGLNGGAPAGTMPGLTPGIAGDMKFGGGGTLQPSPLAPSSTLAPDRNTKHEQLIKLVTGMVRPYSWDGMGGPGRVEYFDLGSALVVNQTADVIREIADLLEALRRLQDLAVAIEVRIISLSESWFERMGVDFSMNISTHNTKFEPNLTSGAFRPEPFINSLQGFKGITAGLTPAGAGVNGNTPVFTPDLAVPIHSTSFNYAIPGFGGYPNNPGADGGVSLGLAFLNDIQVYLFMEAAQGDRRVNVMQAPKLTLFNGQTATISVNELQFFVTDVQVFSVNGQIVFIPQNTPLPGPGSPQQGGGQISIGLQAVVSADRRFVRINIPVTLAAQSGASVPLFPVTTFITPVFEGGSQGVPIPFTQFLQQPSFTSLNIQTTVVCPDGGTVLLGGLKKLSEGRNEFGPPFLSKVPYLNRLFKNVGIGRETQHIMIMITPRIIINSEEEINQTEGGPLGSGGPGR